MKKVIDVISTVSFAVIIFFVCGASIFVGATAANYVRELFNIEGWWCLSLTPIVLAVSICLTLFFLLGLTKFGRNN